MSGMPSNSVSTLALLSSLLAAALCGATAEAPRGTLMAQSEDGILLPASMNDLDDLSVVEEDFEQVSRGRVPTVGGNKEQSLSSLYQLLQAALHQNQLQQQQQGRRLEEAGSETLYPVLPAAVPLLRQPDGLNKDEDKRGIICPCATSRSVTWGVSATSVEHFGLGCEFSNSVLHLAFLWLLDTFSQIF